ncbi:MAG: transposase [Gammaproteobacteria bacterium]
MKPVGGCTWARRRRPHRMRATYHRDQGVEYFLGFYDVHADCFAGVFTKRKRVRELEAAFRRLRACYPRRRVYAILDNLPHVHDHPRFLRLLRQLRITPVYTPTEASWLNLIEAQFGVTKRFTLTDTDDPDHRARRRRIARYIRYRNHQAGSAAHRLAHFLTVRDIKLDYH